MDLNKLPSIHASAEHHQHQHHSEQQQQCKCKCKEDAENFGKTHDWKRIALILSTYVMFIIACGFNSLAGLAWTPTSKLFPKPTGNVSDVFYTDFTPAGWTFSIWGFIYAWQAVWLVYSFTCIFRKSKSGYYLYIRPDFFHYGIFICYIVNMGFNTIWIFLWGYEHLGWALLFIVLLTAALYLLLFISHRKLNENEQLLRDEGLTKDIWFMRFFVQNGIAFYATWVSIASNLNFAIYITWRLGADLTNAGTAALLLVLGAIVLYWVAENFFWRHYLHYTFSPWIVIIVALIGSLSKNWVPASPSRNNIISLIMIIVVVLLIVTRIILFILYKTVLKHKFISFKNKKGSVVHEMGNGHTNGSVIKA